MSVAPTALSRCAAHPGRPAHDACPVCGRLRCPADTAAAPGGGCLVCRGDTGRPAEVARSAATVTAALTRAGWAGTVVALVGAALGQEYVGAHLFSLIWPALVGMTAGSGAMLGIGRLRLPGVARILGAGYGVLSAAYSFHFADTPYGQTGRWLPPLVCAAAAGVLLPGLLTPTAGRRRRTRRPAPTPNKPG
ncbi:MAG: hypothetical protein ACYDAQ_15460 [Mycobacteriales bacterium]